MALMNRLPVPGGQGRAWCASSSPAVFAALDDAEPRVLAVGAAHIDALLVALRDLECLGLEVVGQGGQDAAS